MLVVQVAKEINELRYVLCPKRMTDAQFWQIYFQLAKKYLPEEAFDASYALAQSSTQGMTFADLQVSPFCVPACDMPMAECCVIPRASCHRCAMQVRLAQLSTTAKQWTSQTQASFRNVAAGHFGATGEAPSSALHEIAAARGSGVAAGAATAGAIGAAADGASGEPAAELDADQELEAYLRVRAITWLGNRAGP